MKPTTLDALCEAVKNKEIVSATGNGRTYRFFVTKNNILCQYKKGSSRTGLRFTEEQFRTLEKFQSPKVLTDEDKSKKQFAELDKYRKMAEKASFTNNFVESCKNLPKTFQQWKDEGCKSLYEYHITTGNAIDGKVISIKRIGKQYPHFAERLKQAIINKTETTICSRVPFAGYEMTIEVMNKEGAAGEFKAFLSLEFKGCGNGYYYLLINDENFIGYDVD